jgi:hypothetical protein
MRFLYLAGTVDWGEKMFSHLREEVIGFAERNGKEFYTQNTEEIRKQRFPYFSLLIIQNLSYKNK